MKKRRVTLLKVKKGVYTVGWEVFQPATNGYDAYRLVCEDVPRPELKDTLQALAVYVAEICELPKEAAERILVSGVKLSHKGDKVFYVSMMAHLLLNSSKEPLVLDTPPRPNVGEEHVFCMSSALAYDLNMLLDEVWRYVDGDRAQGSLQFEKDVA